MATVVRRSLMLGTLGRLLRHRAFVIGAVLFGAMVLMAVLAPWLGSGDPNKMAVRFRFQPPSMDHLLGTDNLGRSMLSRVIFGAQLSLLIGLWVVVLNAVFGVLLGWLVLGEPLSASLVLGGVLAITGVFLVNRVR